ncbi:hypothetical protein [Anaerobutyricum hallii]|uniref:hypothetical protein n=1 Tax=Anaerobutyricum hallii TaxID=39488 RepID=UPI00266BD905|nr:hypothetical protein [Anaerobutyricum hallii]
MPYLNITTNAPVNKRQKETIERAISKAILLIPKEKEELLMVNFEDCASLSLSGDFSTPAAMIELRVHNVVIEMNEAELLEKVMSLATEVVSKVLNICPDRIYCTMPAVPYWTAAGLEILKGILK